MPVQTNSPRTSNLFLLGDLEDASRTNELPEGDLRVLRAVADWTRTFAARPHKDLGRSGTVCPFVPVSLEREVLWLAPERIADRSAEDVVQLITSYKSIFLHAQPTSGEDAVYRSIVVVFSDLPANRAKDLLGHVLQQLAAPSYADDGLVLGAFYESNEGSAIYNKDFHPFRSPVPFLLIRQAVISDWKFFMDDKEWLKLWARRFGESAVEALAEELRRFPWRTAHN
jgi:uncharacterized protein DUF6875